MEFYSSQAISPDTGTFQLWLFEFRWSLVARDSGTLYREWGLSNDFRTDALNKGIINILQADPSTTNKDIGDRLGVSEVTIAARIRTMEEQKVLRVMMQRDTRSLGYHLMALIDINVEARRPEDVAQELAQIDECISVSLALSSPDIIIHVLSRDLADLQVFVDTRLAHIEGIASYEIITPLNVVKMDNRYGAVDAG